MAQIKFDGSIRWFYYDTDAFAIFFPQNGLVLTPLAGDPAAPTDGQVWYDSGTDKFRCRENGASVDLRGGGGSTYTADETTLHLASTTFSDKFPLAIGSTRTGDFTLALADDNTIIPVNSATPVTVTVPPNGTVAFPLTPRSAQVTFVQLGAGQIVLAPGSGVTLNSSDTLNSRTQKSVIGIVKQATNTWAVFGDVQTSVVVSGTNTGDQTITLTGDVTGTGTGSFAATIANDAVTYAKMQNVGANEYLGRAANSSGDVSGVAIGASQLAGRGSSGDLAAISLGSGISMSGTTLSATGSSAPIASGSSNPGSPATNDLFFRTDLGLLIYYTGSQWLSLAEYTLDGQPDNIEGITTSKALTRHPVPSDYGIYMTRVNITLKVLATNNGSNYWDLSFDTAPATGAGSNIFLINTSADTVANWVNHDVTVNAAPAAGSKVLIMTGLIHTGSPGAFFFGYSILYRKIIT